MKKVGYQLRKGINLVHHCKDFYLNKHGVLRGYISRFDASEPLYKVVQEMAVASPTQDYRFKPVEEGEVKDLKIEISVLTPMRKISSIDEFQLGKHGIYIRKGIPFGDISSAGRTGDWMDEGRVSRPLCTG